MPKFIRTVQIPNSRDIFTRSSKSSTPVMFQESVVDQHIFDNAICAKIYSDKKFTILLFIGLSFHLSALEVDCIKSCKKNLYRQKEFVYNLKLLYWSRVVTLLSNIRSFLFSFIKQSIEFFFLHSDVYLLTSIGRKV